MTDNAPDQPNSSTVSMDELVGLLSSAVGEKPAREAVEAACRALTLPATGWTTRDALRILDYLMPTPGLLGITARFVKSRAILAWSRR
jgi:hypothetical protein